MKAHSISQHYTYARHHHYCTVCNIIFNTAAGLKVHIEYAPIHGDDSDEEEDESEAGNLQDGWEDDRGADEFPDEVSDFEGEDDVDNSWEEYDDCDFEDEEDLGDPVNEVRPLNCKITSSRSYGTLSTRTTRTRRTRKKK